MKTLLQLEWLAQSAAGISICILQPFTFSWYTWIILLLAPDISMIGYAFSPFTGAITYNLMHHQALAIGFLLAGVLLNTPVLLLAGGVLTTHISFDRMLGYGLKYKRGFRFTHLGNIGLSVKA